MAIEVVPAVGHWDHFASLMAQTGDRGWAIRSAVARLPVRQRAVVVLTYLDDQPDEEIAKLLRCAVGTVKSHRAKALATLRVTLGEPGDLPVGGRA